MIKSVLFVCGENKGRSVAAEYLFRRMLQQRDEELAQQIRVSSAGLVTREDVRWFKSYGFYPPKPFFGKPPYRNLIPAMWKRGIDVSAHRSRGLNRAMVEEAALIIIWDEYPRFRKATLLSLWPWAEGKVFTFKEFVEAEVGGEYLITENPHAVPCAEGDFIGFSSEYLEPCVAEVEQSLIQRMDKFLRYLG